VAAAGRSLESTDRGTATSDHMKTKYYLRFDSHPRCSGWSVFRILRTGEINLMEKPAPTIEQAIEAASKVIGKRIVIRCVIEPEPGNS
jgi:hypothetical protein